MLGRANTEALAEWELARKPALWTAIKRVHGCSNLYLGGSEVFVTGAAIQPVPTIVASAFLLAEALKGQLRDEDLRSDQERRVRA